MNNKEMKECQFKKFGFEKPSFDCEILKKINYGLIGYINNENMAIEWNNLGTAFYGKERIPRYNLTPIKKEWYDNKSNFPCIVTDGKYITVAHKVIKDGGEDILYGVYDGTLDDFLGGVQQFRPLTKEEALELVVKED